MHAVVIRESGPRELVEASGRDVAAHVVPRVRQSPGFVSGTWMTDGTGGTLNVLVFESRAAAESALERVRSAPRPPFLTVESVGLFEVRAIG